MALRQGMIWCGLRLIPGILTVVGWLNDGPPVRAAGRWRPPDASTTMRLDWLCQILATMLIVLGIHWWLDHHSGS